MEDCYVSPYTPNRAAGRGERDMSTAHRNTAATRYRRVLGYARVSSKQQALGSSLTDQQAAIVAGAKSYGLKVHAEDMHVEAVSSLRERIETRIEIQRLMTKVRAGDLVVVDKVDRWSRDPEFAYTSIRQIKEKGANVYFVGEGIDASTDDGDTQLQFRIVFAREEAKRIRLRMVGTRKKLRDRGHWVEGRPPLGYRLPVDGEERHRLVVVKDDAATVRRIFRMSIAGKGAVAISKDLGVPMQRVRSVLVRARLYTGEMQNAEGDWIKGRHDPIIDQATYERVHLAMQSRRSNIGSRGPNAPQPGSRTEGWVLRDVATCAHCAGKMTARFSGASTGSRPASSVFYYTCYRSSPSYRAHARNREIALRTPNAWNKRPMAPPCGHPEGIRVEEVEAIVVPLIADRLTELHAIITAAIKRKPKPTDGDDEAADISARLVRLAQKRERLVDALGDGTLTKDAYTRALRKVEDDEMALRERSRKIARPRALDNDEARVAFLKRVEKLRETWDRSAARPVLRREMARQIVKSVAMAKGQAPVVTWYTMEEMGA